MSRPLQFRLRTMFWLVALVGVLCLVVPRVAPFIRDVRDVVVFAACCLVLVVVGLITFGTERTDD